MRTALLAAALFALTAAPAAAFGPQTGDDCARWIACPNGATATGQYPLCDCGDISIRPPPPPTCQEIVTNCAFPNTIEGTPPNDCFCRPPEPVPGPVCGRCEVLHGNVCIPFNCR